MLTFSQLIVSMWFVPLFLFILLPLALLAGRLLSGALLGVAGRTVTAPGDGNTLPFSMPDPINKRHHPRFRITGISADVSDGNQLCTGLTCNISRSGIGILDVPEKFFQRSAPLSVVISGREKIFRMSVRPKWHDKNGPRNRIGGELLHPPHGWQEFISHYERIFSDLGHHVPETAAAVMADR
ncbi:MAG: PilZ domain-containing protein [Thermodesulfobacteriota bacterium]